MSAEEFSRYDSMKLFLHQIYEFQKGVRSLVLCTMCRTCASLLSERLGRLGKHIQRVLEDICRELAAGNIAADPFWRGPDHNACQWCEYAAACHFEEGRGGDRRRFLPAVRGEEFWQAVAKEQV